MKIAIVSLSYLPISEDTLGGLETFVYSLSQALTKKGHEVTLFGLEESKISGKVVGITNLKQLREENLALDNKFFVRRYVTYQAMAFDEAQKHNFDCIHVNLAEWQMGFLLNRGKNVVVTAHGNYLGEALTKKIFEKYTLTKLVNISKFCLNILFPKYQKQYLIYNGIEIEKYQPKFSKGNYLVWLGRITPIKGLEVAIEVAKKLNKKLIIAGGIDYQDYFDEKVKPDLDKNIQFIGPVFGKKKNKLLAEAEALLFTSNYPEACPMVPAEAMACGTPVIAFDKGALAEIVENKKTGFIVQNATEMIEKVKQIDTISRSDCRKRVEENFTLERMVNQYLEIYRK